MIKITAKNDWQHSKWYFYTIEECDVFIRTLKDHGADIDWNEPARVPLSIAIGANYRSDMNKDPRERAIEALGWAFNSYIPDNPKCNKSKEMAGAIMGMGLID